jgi:hypothetical protein
MRGILCAQGNTGPAFNHEQARPGVEMAERKERARIEALDARERAIVAHHTDPMVGIPSSIAAGLMVGALAGVLGGGAVALVSRNLTYAMTTISKGTGICALGGAVINVYGYVQQYKHSWTTTSNSAISQTATVFTLSKEND